MGQGEGDSQTAFKECPCPFESLLPFLWDCSKIQLLFTSRSFSPIYNEKFVGAGHFLPPLWDTQK